LNILLYVLLGIGVLSNGLGAIALVRFPDVYTRLHGATKCTTFGSLFTGLGVIVYGFSRGGVQYNTLAIHVIIAQTILHVVVLVLIVIGAALAVWFKDLLASVLALAATGLLVALEFFLLQAPDVAIAEASIGAALTTAIYVIAIRRTMRKEEE
jgi:energy-converting hydrogenase B subunit D